MKVKRVLENAIHGWFLLMGLVTVEGKALSAAAQSFFDYATSTAANDLIKAAGAVPVAK